MLCFRVSNIETNQGLWYDQQGNFTGLIHSKMNFCKSSCLVMPLDPDLIGWVSVTTTLNDLFQWFPIEDIKRLQDHGIFATIHEAINVREYRGHYNHLVMEKETSSFLSKIVF